ncbi:MAG: multiubiquitin domain-containing protein [Deltaproteobacteria bacterium]|nr:multiubiquitin domain-containing protein [Deltaproteobacteria bacterium]
MALSDDKTSVESTPEGGVVIQIDRKEYRLTDKPPDTKIVMTGWELRKLADPEIDEKRDLFLVVPGGSDKKIGNDEELEIHDGMRFFSAPALINPGARESREEVMHATTR